MIKFILRYQNFLFLEVFRYLFLFNMMYTDSTIQKKNCLKLHSMYFFIGYVLSITDSKEYIYIYLYKSLKAFSLIIQLLPSLQWHGVGLHQHSAR